MVVGMSFTTTETPVMLLSSFVTLNLSPEAPDLDFVEYDSHTVLFLKLV